MAITVQHAPPLAGISSIAQEYGGNMENQRQQQLALNLEGVAQRERMQGAELGFRDRAMQFQAATNRQNLLSQLAAQQQRQTQALQADQQNLAFQQMGRERLASFGAQQDQLGRFQNFQMQQELQNQEWGNRSQYAREQLNLEGQARMREFDRQRDALREAAGRYGFSEEQLQYGMMQIDSREAGVDYSQYHERVPTVEETIRDNTWADLDNGTLFIRQPDGKVDVRPIPEKREGRVVQWTDGTEYQVGSTKQLDDGTVLHVTDSGWEVLREPPQPVQEDIDNVRNQDRIRWIQQQAQYYMNQIDEVQGRGDTVIRQPRYDRQSAWREAMEDYENAFGGQITPRVPEVQQVNLQADGIGLDSFMQGPVEGWDVAAESIHRTNAWLQELEGNVPPEMSSTLDNVRIANDVMALLKESGRSWSDLTPEERNAANGAMHELHYFYEYIVKPNRNR